MTTAGDQEPAPPAILVRQPFVFSATGDGPQNTPENIYRELNRATRLINQMGFHFILKKKHGSKFKIKCQLTLTPLMWRHSGCFARVQSAHN